MENLNNGKSIRYEDISDFTIAAKSFAEGNKTLEILLLNCFKRNLQTVACCKGHKEKHQLPYISFKYTKENQNFIYYILARLKDKGYIFRYNKLDGNNSFFSIEENKEFNYETITTLFTDITEYMKSYFKEINYYYLLDEDLKRFIEIMNNAENDDLLSVTPEKGLFQMSYRKTKDGYEYTFSTTDSYYCKIIEENGFNQIPKQKIPSYIKNVSSNDMINSDLKRIQQETKPNIESKEIEIQVELGQTLESIAEKLIEYKQNKIRAYATFNNIVISNYYFNTSSQIVEYYFKTLEKIKNNFESQENKKL